MVEFVMQRSVKPCLITTFLPTIIINIIGHVTLYMKEDDLQCAVAVNLTVLLVLTTM